MVRGNWLLLPPRLRLRLRARTEFVTGQHSHLNFGNPLP